MAAVVAVALLLSASAAAAGVLRAMRVPGAGLAGGVLAGVLLGPTVAGRIAPVTWEDAFAGGRAVRAARDALLVQREADVLAGADTADTDAALADAVAAWERATWTHRAPLRWATLLAVGATLLLAGAAGRPCVGPAPASAAVASIAAWSAGVPATLVVAIVHLGPPRDWRELALAAAAVAIGPFLVRGGDRVAAEAAELGGARLVLAAGHLASALAIAVVLASLPPAVIPWGLVLLALPLGRLLDAPSGPAWSAVRDAMLVPAVAAGVAVTVDLHGNLALWPLVALLLASGDGRWLGATIGAILTGGRRWLRTMRLVSGAMACGPTQLAVAAVALHTRAIPPDLGLAILAGALLIELSAPMRRRVVEQLGVMEE